MTALSAPAIESRQGRNVMWAGLGIVLTAINLRTAVTGFTTLLEMIGLDIGYGTRVAGLLGTVPAASFAVFGFLAPVVTRKFGLERTATVALGLTTLGVLMRAFSPTPVLLVLSTVVALAGIGAANVVIVPLVKVWFGDRLALWTAAYLICLQAGQFIAPLVAVPVAESVSWRFSVGIWAGPILIGAVVWLVLALRLPARVAEREVTQESQPRVRVSRSATVWGLVLLFGMMSISNYGIITWVPAILTDAGADAALGGSMVALYSAWGMLAAFVVPQVATRIANPFIVVVVCSGALLVGYFGLMRAPLGGTFIWICALGIGVSTFPLCMTLINHRTKSAQTASSVSGFVQGIGYAIAAVGPIGLGFIRDATASWSLPLVVLMATVIPTLAAGWFACRDRFVEDEVAAV